MPIIGEIWQQESPDTSIRYVQITKINHNQNTITFRTYNTQTKSTNGSPNYQTLKSIFLQSFHKSEIN